MNNRKHRLLFFVTGVVLLLIGIAYYLQFRADTLPPLLFQLVQLAPFMNAEFVLVPSGVATWFPSFIHVFAWSLLLVSVLPWRPLWLIAPPVFWFSMNGINEFFYWKNSAEMSFHLDDILASAIAVILFLGLCLLYQRHLKGKRALFRHSKTHTSVLSVALICGGLFSITGSNHCGEESGVYCPVETLEPVYLSYEELRSSVAVDTDRKLKESGKIYVYQEYLFISETNQGIHIYDNSDEAAPVHLGFITVLGNQDMAIKDGLLYVDSFIDLVTIDLRDAQDIREINRVEDVFDYNAYQMIDDSKQGMLSIVDESKGVVIGYKGDTE